MQIDKNLYKHIGDNISLITSSRISLVFSNLYNLINDSKSKIDQNSVQWDKIKKISNPYELIHISYNKEKNNNSIAKYIPLSRSYFKMWEIIYDYNLFKNMSQPIITACLAEGPGGFMEAIYNYRKNSYNDRLYGITLPPENKYIPGWKKIKDNHYYNFEISYGNLYNIQDIYKFSKNFNINKAHIVTADGGFDYSIDFNNQEQLSYRIIFCEIVTALGIQRIGGHFICKIFDIFTLFTLKIIYLIYCLYDEVYIMKPKTSRTANSEKYLVAKGFKGIDNIYLSKLYKIIENWDIKNNEYPFDINGLKFDNKFIHCIFKYNNIYTQNQLEYINKTIKYIHNKPDKELYTTIIKKQIQNAKEWCNKYDMIINQNSRFLHYLN